MVASLGEQVKRCALQSSLSCLLRRAWRPMEVNGRCIVAFDTEVVATHDASQRRIQSTVK